MKAKTKKTVKRKCNRPVKKTRRSVKYVHAKKPLLKHFRFIDKKHTFRLIHFRHTSHVTLIIALVLLGFLLYFGNQVVRSYSTSSDINIGAVVNSPPPSIGAQITSPKSGDRFSDKEITVYGTCQANTFVVVRSNDLTVGSSQCTSAGIFSLTIQLEVGLNILSALNYDNLNQAGPSTTAVSVRFESPIDSSPVRETTSIIKKYSPVNPSIIPSLLDKEVSCSNKKIPSKLTTGGPPRVTVTCIPRLFLPKITHTLGVVAWGGNPPYAININWGDGSENTLISVPKPGYTTVDFSYEVAGTYHIFIRMTDKERKTATTENSTTVNGKVISNQPIEKVIGDVVDTVWFKASVPLYFLAVAITIGFWCGDIFERFTVGHKRPRTRKRST